MSAKLIGLLGGSFDPVHLGHLRLGVEAAEQLQLDELRLIPSRSPPHKAGPVASNEQRLQLLQQAIEGNPLCVADDLEFHRSGASYTVDTLKILRQQHPDAIFVWILGADAFAQFTQWQSWQTILTYSHLAVSARPQYHFDKQQAWMANRWLDDSQALKQHAAGKLISLDVTQMDISSSQIRRILRANKSARYLLPEKVWHTISHTPWYQ